MQVSFGQFIPVTVYCNKILKGPGNNLQKTPYSPLRDKDSACIEEITDQFAKQLSRREKGQINQLSEQQRRVFRANIPDYSLPPAVNFPQESDKTSAVVGLTIGENRYLVTGVKDVSFVQSNLYRQVNPYMFEKEVIGYINKNHALSDKKAEIFVSEMPDDTYRVNIVDFKNAISSRPIVGECAQ